MNKNNLTPFPELMTRRFILRQLRSDDDNEIFILRSDERVLKYLDRPKAESINDARLFIEKINSGIKNNDSIYWAVSYKNESKLVGTICFWNITDSPFKVDIGFEILPGHQGKGIMQEILPEVLEYGFKVAGFEKIIGEVEPGNIKSIKVMEKFGFKLEDSQSDILIYSLKKGDY